MKILHLVLATVAGSTCANAAELFYRREIGSGASDHALDWRLPRFNLGIGNLQSVRIDLFVDVQGTVTVENTLPFTATIGLSAAERFQFDAGIGEKPASVVAEASAQVVLPAFDGTLDGAGDSGRTVAAHFSAMNQVTLTSGLQRFLATPSEASLDARLLLDGFLQWSPAVFVRPTLAYRGTVQVVYVYEPFGSIAPTPPGDGPAGSSVGPQTARVDAMRARELGVCA